jgi:ribosomal protein S18 acetylase RimI-like enzyme
MKTTNIRYKIKTATENEIFSHLTECSDTFVPPLAEGVNINEYAKKIFEKSVTFEAWADKLLVGFIAAYFNDNVDGSAFITNVSVLKKFIGLGIASKLLDMCIEHARKNNFREIMLEVHKRNNAAICLYNKFSFKNYETEDDILLLKRKI